MEVLGRVSPTLDSSYSQSPALLQIRQKEELLLGASHPVPLASWEVPETLSKVWISFWEATAALNSFL